MNPFELFLHLKSEIEGNEEIMHNLRKYAYTWSGKLRHYAPEWVFGLKCLGDGWHHRHFRMGHVSDYWIATREYKNYRWGLRSEVIRVSYENYITELIGWHVRGRRTPLICGGVCAHSNDLKKYFLLIEDLTRGGTSDFTPDYAGSIGGTLDGKPVLYDSKESFVMPQKGYIYMANGNLLHLRA